MPYDMDITRREMSSTPLSTHKNAPLNGRAYSVNSFELDTNRSINNYTYNARVLYNARDYY